MEKWKIGLDVDGVLANWYLAMCRRFNKPYVTIDNWEQDWLNEEYKKVKDFSTEQLERENRTFWKTLPIISHCESINFTVSGYITAMEEKLFHERLYWLYVNSFPNPNELHISFDKRKFCLKNGFNVLVDDKLSTLIDLRDNSDIIPIKFTPDYLVEDCPEGIYEIKHLSQVPEILSNL